ncbi:MAG: GxxExxY protein [Planctomycetes bacterium RBG_16_55_9]|nr:MAG: GxxExxY protein [Planctomycetes bacterium RBG_16_55_9]
MDENEIIIHKDLSYKIIELALEVHNELGCGFLEKVYENALMMLLERENILAKQQAQADVYFQGKVIGQYFADILVDNKIILELKTVNAITDVHKAQVLNYLRATGLKLGLILNFAKPRLEYKRLVL